MTNPAATVDIWLTTLHGLRDTVLVAGELAEASGVAKLDEVAWAVMDEARFTSGESMVSPSVAGRS